MTGEPTLPGLPGPDAPLQPWILRFGSLTDPGRARDRNEDACAVFVPWSDEARAARGDALFLVADGMGGHEAGDLASAFVAAHVRGWFARGTATGLDPDDFERALRSALLKANAGLLSLARDRAISRGIGSTATVACIRGDQLHAAHVGDTRLYRLRKGVLDVLTQDHSWVGEQQRAGLLTEEEAGKHPQRHMLTECLGVGEDVRIDVVRRTAMPGDRYLLCSDGLHGVVNREEIATTLGAGTDPQQTARTLVAMANERDGPDNITAVVVHLDVETAGQADGGAPVEGVDPTASRDPSPLSTTNPGRGGARRSPPDVRRLVLAAMGAVILGGVAVGGLPGSDPAPIPDDPSPASSTRTPSETEGLTGPLHHEDAASPDSTPADPTEPGPATPAQDMAPGDLPIDTPGLTPDGREA